MVRIVVVCSWSPWQCVTVGARGHLVPTVGEGSGDGLSGCNCVVGWLREELGAPNQVRRKEGISPAEQVLFSVHPLSLLEGLLPATRGEL